jgi:hypothetical protein
MGAALSGLAVCLAAAGCGGEKQLNSAGDGSAALADWQDFPVGATPRPVVLVGPSTVGPAGPERGGPGYQPELGRGDVLLPKQLPPRPPRTGGFTVMSAQDAAQLLHVVPSRETTLPSPLRVTGIRFGTGVFDTDRGSRRLPAWLFSFAGVTRPAAVLAVPPFLPHNPSEGPATAGDNARVSQDGRTVTIDFVGYGPGRGACATDYIARVAESATAVAILIDTSTAKVPDGTVIDCAAPTHRQTVTVTLSAPLGARVLIDGRSHAAYSRS